MSDACAHRTMAAVGQLAHAEVDQRSRTAMFRLVVHLPLVLPAHCGFRVGGETRIILICDVWSPRLSPEERAAIRSVIAATDAFRGTVPTAHI
jgi:aspartate beta-hydroxylase